MFGVSECLVYIVQYYMQALFGGVRGMQTIGLGSATLSFRQLVFDANCKRLDLSIVCP